MIHKKNGLLFLTPTLSEGEGEATGKFNLLSGFFRLLCSLYWRGEGVAPKAVLDFIFYLNHFSTLVGVFDANNGVKSND